MLTPSSPIEDVLADLDCPISDQERIAWAEEIRALRKDAERYFHLRQRGPIPSFQVKVDGGILFRAAENNEEKDAAVDMDMADAAALVKQGESNAT